VPEFRVSFWGVEKADRWKTPRAVVTSVEAAKPEDVPAVLGEKWLKVKGLKINTAAFSLYDELVKVMTPNEIDHHESDLYVLRNEKSQPLVEGFVGSHTTFVGSTDRRVWYDVPFAYKPFWDKVSDRAAVLTEAYALLPSAPGHLGWKKPKPRLTR
jgi:hypothetical protein